MISKTPSSQVTQSASSSRSSSTHPPSTGAADGWDADDEDAMSYGDRAPTARSLAVPIPQVSGPYCPLRPNLKQILANTSPPPWTLAAFMAYLSNNHCLETLEFTMDAGRYKKHYAKMLAKSGDDGMPSAKDREYVQLLWVRLIDAYVRPNGSREVNLPSSVRDPILKAPPRPLPPSPDTLEPAVEKTFELMEESVLVPFLNSCYSQTPTQSGSSWYEGSDDVAPVVSQSFDEHHSLFGRRSRHARGSPPPHAAAEPQSHSHPLLSNAHRQSAPSTIPTSQNKSRLNIRLTHTHPSNSAASTSSEANLSGTGSGSGPGMTDDSGSGGSPTNDGPMTPPTSPPLSDVGSTGSSSPRHSRDSGMWKKLGRLSGMKTGKKKVTSGGYANEEN